MSIEELFFNNNAKTAINVAQARGVILITARINKLDIFEYTPLQIKQWQDMVEQIKCKYKEWWKWY